uniref:SEA domain-containing protein n=1 Tax=Heterorhabditis bacteriophora TaxID=37862 RepID=A0A1I7X067_HETBA
MIFYFLLVSILTKGDDNIALNENYSTPNKTFISSIYQVQLEIATPVIYDNDVELARRIELVVGDGLSAARAKHLRKSTMAFAERRDSEDVKVEVRLSIYLGRKIILINWKRVLIYSTMTKTLKHNVVISRFCIAIIIKHRTAGSSTFLHFLSWVGGELLLGEIIASDISLLSASHISAVLQYPFTRIISQKEIEETNSYKWWIAALIIGAGLLLLCLGWLILFLYFNTCGATKIPYEVTKTVYYKDITTQCDSQIFHSEKKQNYAGLNRNMRSNDAFPQLKDIPPVVHELADADLNTGTNSLQ